MQQLREALKILAERVLILEHMIGIHGRNKNRGAGNRFSRPPECLRRKLTFGDVCSTARRGPVRPLTPLLKETFRLRAAAVSSGWIRAGPSSRTSDPNSKFVCKT